MNDAVQQIKARLSIVDVVASYVELHKAGRNFKGKSPFSNERTPSFYVSPERGMYYCFSTTQGGDMFSFVQAMEGVDFKGALKILADKAHVELVPVSPEKKNERDRLYAAMEDATVYYEATFTANTDARAYVLKRGVSEATIKSWRIGCVGGPPQGWALTRDALKQKGYTDTELLKAGLIKQSEKGKDFYDVFRNRIMFPLCDPSGRVVGFSGRTLEVGDNIPKYVNSPETDLYKKSDLLFGYDKAKQGIRHFDFSLIVEGQFDVVMSHQAGYTNTVAVSGTALTEAHVEQLQRLSNNVVLALDADRAGIAAVKRSADIMLRRGLDVKVASLPGKDPADIVLSDVKEYKKAIGSSVHVIQYLLGVLASKNLPERTFKLQAREEILPFILLLPNKIDQDHFEGIVAETLKTTKEAIHFEVERLAEGKKATPVHESEKRAVVSPAAQSQASATRKQSLLAYLVASIVLLPKQEAVEAALTEIMDMPLGEISDAIPAEVKAEVLFVAEGFLDKNPARVFYDEYVHKLNQLRDVVVREQISIAREMLREAEETGEEARISATWARISSLEKKRQAVPLAVEMVM